VGAAADYVATVIHPGGEPEAIAIQAASDREKDAEVAALDQGGDDVVAVEPAAPVRALTIDDPVYGGTNPGPQWGVARVHAETAWGGPPPAAQGQGVVVGIVDSGVQGSHPDLAGRVLAGRDYVAPTFDGTVDPFGHGTHVAGIIAENDNTLGGIGVAPQVSILPVRVLNCSGIGSTEDVANGITWAADHGAKVINLSLGTPSANSAIQIAVSYATGKGATVVASAGNCGQCQPPNDPSYPAADSPAIAGLLAVAATCPPPTFSPPQAGCSSDKLASFSNGNDYVDVAAPGAAIWSSIPQSPLYGTKSGTSMAAPFVTAVAALVRAKCPSYTPAQTESRLESTAENLGVAQPGRSWGAGMIRADLAVAPAC
jgi:subtilisin family serine protease